ncbi:MAG: hypothetical protein AVDCRST_MAG18-3261, partial [uncultured Thermomicrobiales bacterium]
GRYQSYRFPLLPARFGDRLLAAPLVTARTRRTLGRTADHPQAPRRAVGAARPGQRPAARRDRHPLFQRGRLARPANAPVV